MRRRYKSFRKYEGDIDIIINSVLCRPEGITCTKEQRDALKDCITELPYIEGVVITKLMTNYNHEKVANIIEVSEKFVQAKERKAINALRAPRRYYRIKYGVSKQAEMEREHVGVTRIKDMNLSTKTVNVLKRNNFIYFDEFVAYIRQCSILASCVPGLGKIGLSEIMDYYDSLVKESIPVDAY